MFTVTFQEPSKELYDVVMKVKMLNGFPMLEITGNIPTFQYFTAGDFKTEVIVNSWLNYEIKHTFHGVEMLRLTVDMLNGFPRMEITGKIPAFKYLKAGAFKTEVIVNSWLNYEMKHTFNGVEMLRATFGMLNGFPRIEITGKMPNLKYLTAGTFKSEGIVHSLLNYEVKHAFNGVEMLKLTFGMLNGFPRIEITGKISTFKYFTAGDFKTEVIVNSWLNYEIKHIFNGLEMLRLTFQMLNGFPMIEITGNLPATPLFTAGVFKSQLIVKSLYKYEIKHIFKGMEILNLKIALINGKMEMIMKYGQTHKTHIVLEYEYLRWIKILLPTTNTWLSKDLGFGMHYQPTNEEKMIEGGNIKIVAKSDNMPVMKFGGYYGLTLDSKKFEILLNDFYINLLNNEIMLFDGITISELKFYGKIALHHLNMNVMSCHAMSCHLNLKTMIPKIALEAKIQKDEQKVFHYLLTTMETPCKVHIFFPYVFQNILGLAQEHMEITHEHVVLGHKQVITTLCNLTTKKIITKVTPTMMSFELFDGEVSLIKYVTELTKIDVGKNSLILEGNKIVQFNAHKPWFLPSELKFYGKIALQHLNMNVIDYLHLNTMIPKITLEAKIHKDEQKVFHYLLTTMETPMKLHIFFPYLFQNILSMSQEHVEISHEHVVLGNKQVITTLCNLTTKKLITKVTPTMMSIELFDGEVSLVKYVTELTKIDVGRNAMLLEGNKIVQFTGYQPWFLPAILKFNQLKTKFHLEVVDKAERKININVAVFKDTTELLNAVVNNVEVPYMIVVKAPVLPLELRFVFEQSSKVWDVKINNKSYLKARETVPYMLVVKAPVLPLEMRIDYELSTKVWDVKINTKSYLKVRPTLVKEVEVVLTGVPLFRVALLAKELRITTIMKDLPEITTAVTLKTFSLFQNTLGIEVMVGKISHKTLLGWNINMLRKAFVDVKVIGS